MLMLLLLPVMGHIVAATLLMAYLRNIWLALSGIAAGVYLGYLARSFFSRQILYGVHTSH